MGYTLRQFTAEDKFSQVLTVEALSRAVPLADIKAVLQEEGVHAQRERKLHRVVTMFIVLAMKQVFRKDRFLVPNPRGDPAGKA